MSNLEIKRLLQEIQTCQEKGLIFPALFMSLSLPDLCGKIDDPNSKSKARYIKWFNKYVDPEINPLHYAFPETKAGHEFDAKACYALRCSLLHAGDTDIHKAIDIARFDIDFRTVMAGNLFNNKTDVVLEIDEKGEYKWVPKSKMSIAAILIVNSIVSGARTYLKILEKNNQACLKK